MMKNLNKIICFILIAVMSFSLVACVFNNDTTDTGNSAKGNVSGNSSSKNASEGVTFTEVNPIDKSDASDAGQYTAVNEVTMESTTDRFNLLEKAYGESDKFVYTATATFETGVATGLAFGAEDNSHYWVFNVDREANLVKLIYFTVDGGKIKATELLTDYFIGNDKMTDSEKRLVGSRVASVETVQLKVVITPEQDGVYAEFYADNIRRFGIDNEIELNSLEKLPEGVSYTGGNIGFNCFNSKVKLDSIYYGKSDYSYYTELYRNQYHFSQYAHWNNDPNGLVYYDGYYHLFYQHHPYSNYWSDMYWGHARSTDLAHWELLPICLFPDEDWGTGVGYMWSGTAYEYRYGDSAAIDALGWFPEGEGNGLM